MFEIRLKKVQLKRSKHKVSSFLILINFPGKKNQNFFVKRSDFLGLCCFFLMICFDIPYLLPDFCFVLWLRFCLILVNVIG